MLNFVTLEGGILVAVAFLDMGVFFCQYITIGLIIYAKSLEEEFDKNFTIDTSVVPLLKERNSVKGNELVYALA